MKVIANAFAGVLATLFICSSPHRVNAHTVEFARICFSPGRPSQLETSADMEELLDQEQMGGLLGSLRALKENPILGVKVVGYADKDECRPRECVQLSLRRAKIVFDWFFDHGVPVEQLRGPSGESTDWPLDSGETEDGRALNRRVQLEPYSLREAGSR